MEFKNIKIFVISMFFIYHLSACSMNVTRGENGGGHAYVATEQSGYYFACFNGAALGILFPALIITLPLTTFDIAASLVTDTLFLPYDLMTEPERDYRQVNKGCIH